MLARLLSANPTSHGVHIVPQRVPSVRRRMVLPSAVQVERPNARARGYDADWQKLRAAFLRDHPICSTPDCGRPSKHADHSDTVIARPDRRLDRTNLTAYCHSCHSSKTARHDGGFGNRRKGEGASKV